MLLVAEAQPDSRQCSRPSSKRTIHSFFWDPTWRNGFKITGLKQDTEAIRTAIRNHEGAALLIQGGLPGKNGPQNVVYMRSRGSGFIDFFSKKSRIRAGWKPGHVRILFRRLHRRGKLRMLLHVRLRIMPILSKC